MEAVLAVLIGLGLAAACGFRVFVPLAVVSIAARAGWLGISPTMQWLGSDAAIIALSTATVLEIVAYKVPWLDHALDTIATPAAVIAGAIVSASQVGTIIPQGNGGEMLMWAAAIIGGGAVAGTVQAATVTTRAASTVLTAGFANPVLNVGQSVGAVGLSTLTIAAPFLAAVLVIGILAVSAFILVWMLRRRAARAALARAT